MSAGHDEALGRWLLDRGVIAPSALRHALALKRRGAERVPLTDILVELEHVSAPALADAVAEMSGCARWDGRIAPQLVQAAGDPDTLERARTFRRVAEKIPDALVVSLDGSAVRYATATPHDERVRDGIRFATGARRAEPVCATDEQLARARAALGFGVLPTLTEADVSTLPSADEETLRRSWASEDARDEAWQRVPNALLIDLAAPFPGACFRSEVSDEVGVRAGSRGFFDRWVPLPGALARRRRLLELCVQRLAYMAELPPGDHPAQGSLRLRLASRDVSFAVERRRTADGSVLLVRRCLRWLGECPPDEPAFARYRSAAARAAELGDDGRVDEAVNALRDAHEAARAIGPDADIERLASLWGAGTLLDSSEREAEARPCMAEALALARELEIGSRLEGTLVAQYASTEMDSAERRGELFTFAAQALDADGPARDPIGFVLLERQTTESILGATAAVAATASAIRDNDVAWFGAPTELCFSALLTRAESEIAALELARAEATLAEARVLAPVATDSQAGLDWIAGQLSFAGQRDAEAVELLGRALDSGVSPRVAALLRADLALALERTGRTDLALEHARRALPELEKASAFGLRRRQAVSELLRRARAYR